MIKLGRNIEDSIKCCFGGGGDGGAGALRKQQQEDALRREQGMQQINSVFGGGTYGTEPVKVYDPKGSYFLASGDPYKFDTNDPNVQTWWKQSHPEQFLLKPANLSHVTQNPAQLAAVADAYGKWATQKGLLYGNKATSTGFNDQFYNDRKQAQLDVQMPQMGQQFQQTQKGLAYQLASKGLLKSSAATNLGQSLKNEFGFQKQNLNQAAQGGANQLRGAVEGQRQAVVGQLSASSDPAAALQLATGAAASLNAPSTFAPLANLFSNWQNMYLANQVSGQNQQQQMFNPYIMFGGQGVNNPLGSGSARTIK